MRGEGAWITEEQGAEEIRAPDNASDGLCVDRVRCE
jgi:hypothetical protein